MYVSQKREINRKMFYSLALFVANGIGRVTNIHVVIVMKRSNILKLVECILNISSDTLLCIITEDV